MNHQACSLPQKSVSAVELGVDALSISKPSALILVKIAFEESLEKVIC